MINEYPKKLYHYTSFETLALILSNRTICFNNLLNVDDIEEAETKDMGNFGKYVYVSCWTDDSKESISLWNLYTPDMHGVRICLPCFPFKKYSYKTGQYFLKEDVTTYINLKKEYEDNKAMMSLCQPLLIQVEYTNENAKVIPQVRESNPVDAVQQFLNANDLGEIKNVKVKYSFEKLGKYKRMDWEFQHEWRYIITMMPMGFKEFIPLSLEKQQEVIRRIENSNTEAPYKKFFLDLDENSVKQMEIVLGPRMSDAEKIYIKSLLKDHGLENNWRESNLRIRNRSL